jgi:hypothetical protein
VLSWIFGSIGRVAVVSPAASASRRLFVDTLGLALAGVPAGDLHSETSRQQELRHPASRPGRSGLLRNPDWPTNYPVPQASIEFEIAAADAVATAADKLARRGLTRLHDSQLQPCRQTVARPLSPAGLIIGNSFAPRLQP